MRILALGKASLAVLLASAAAACAGSAPRSPESPTGPHVKVLTFNVNYGGPAPGLALEAIAGEDADLVCLQETTPAWEAFLRPRLKDRYPHADFHHSGGAGGLALFSKHPFRRNAVLPSAVGWFPTGVYTVETPAGPLQVFNVHLHPAVNEKGSFTPYAYLSSAPEARLRETREIHRHVDPALPVLWAGDFNEGDSGDSIGWLAERGLKDALPEFDATTKTWRWTTSVGITVKHRLDHLLYSPGLRCLEARVLQKGASDHYPVVAVFERAAP